MKKAIDATLLTSPDYRQFIEDLKARVISARLSAARSMNKDVIVLYWDIGRELVEKQAQYGWGDSVVQMVAADLQRAFPDTRGFSVQNVWRMRQFYLTHTANEFLSQVVREIEGAESWTSEKLSQVVRELVAQVPWGHHANVLAKVTDPGARLYYLQATVRFGWTRDVLLNQTKACAYERAVVEKKTHNFDLVLPEHLAEQADEMLKSSYNLEFLGLRRAVRERELEDRLISRLQAFLLELGYGFCFVGRQYRRDLHGRGRPPRRGQDIPAQGRAQRRPGGERIRRPSPERATQTDVSTVSPFQGSFHIMDSLPRATATLAQLASPCPGLVCSAPSGQMHDSPNRPSFLARMAERPEKDDIEVEYALRSKTNPIGVAAYQLHPKLPGEFKGKLPTARQLAGVVRAEMEGGK